VKGFTSDGPRRLVGRVHFDRRQLEAEARSLTFSPPVQPPAVSLGRLPGDEQPKPDAIHLSGDEWLEELRCDRAIGARPAIPNLNHAPTVDILLNRDLDLPTGARGLDRIRQKVDDDVPEPAGIAAHDWIRRGRFPAQLYIRVTRLWAEQRNCLVDQLNKVARSTRDVGPPEIEESSDIGFESGQLPAGHVQRLRVTIDTRPRVQLDRELGAGHGIAQLVSKPAGNLAEKPHPFALRQGDLVALRPAAAESNSKARAANSKGANLPTG
jgi:hypothetical protein